ncbi:hypothetical protein BGZ46_000879 [Entomortierella lignicola]|nr:hypothetical protein BGZ46_000879 [Entomortierella lignicola]
MTSTTGAWSSLFQGVPNTTPASRLYTEEAIQNDQLTADEVIEKAQSSANLLYEIVTALNEEQETLGSFEKNDILQTIFHECQEMSNYLSARIWDDSDDSNSRYQLFDSSTSRSAQKTAEEEAQIASFIACNEEIQVALKRYNEFKDLMSAKRLQETELVEDHAYQSRHGFVSGSRIDPSSTYTSAAVTLDDGDDDEDIDTQLRRSEQPVVWKLDPREDFRANQAKMKKFNQEEYARASDIRWAEKSPRNGVHGISEDPNKITPEMLSEDDVTEGRKSLEEGAGESAAIAATEPVVEVDEDGLERIINRPQIEEDNDDEEEEETEDIEDDVKSVLSDDSWEEIPTQAIVSLSIDGEDVDNTATTTDATQEVSPTTSSISSFTMVPAEASSRTPTPPSAAIREL